MPDYRFDKFDGESLSECARKCNLRKKTLIEWVNGYGSEGASPDTTELSESSPEATVSHPVEVPLLNMPWEEVARLCPATHVDPDECLFEK